MRNNKTFPYYLLIACFFLSGTAALMYEMLWVRTMSLFLGNSTWAISTVIGSFMAGLAAGSYGGGKLSDRIPRCRLVALYALLELGIAVSAGLSRPILKYAQTLTLSGGIMELPYPVQSVIWFLLGFGILLVPTALMGATLPVLSRWFIHSTGQTGSRLGVLYAANTCGALGGALLTGFYLIPQIGMTKSFMIAIAFNIICAVSVWAWCRETDGSAEDRIDPGPAEAIRYVPAVILVCAGCASMICQLAWIRAMVLILGSSTYVFTIVLCTFLFGLTLGSTSAGFLLKKYKPSWEMVSIIAGAIAVSLILTHPLYNRLPYWVVRLYQTVKPGTPVLRIIHFFICFTVMIIPTVLMGGLFPVTIACSVKNIGRIGGSIGTYAMINITGNILGSLVCGFLLIPVVGIENSLMIAMGLYVTAAFLAALRSSFFYKKTILAGCAAVIVLSLFILPRWDPAVMSAGVFMYAPVYQHVKSYREFRRFVNRNEILYHKDGQSSTVTVLQSRWQERFLRVNGKTDASWGDDMKTQLLLAHLPRVFYKGSPKQILVIGLGAGVTAGACSVYPGIEAIDCVELEPAVSKAAMFFTRVNRWISKDPRFNLVFTDARHYLTGSKKMYDLIISEPSNPWMAGVAALYTAEAFELVKKRLTRNGIFCQWIHSYSMSEKDFRMILATFASVFPHMMLMTPKTNDFLILGSQKPITFDYPYVQELMENNADLMADLRSIGIGHPFTLLSTTFVLDDRDVRAYAKGAAIHRDDRLTLEFSAPLFLYRGEASRIALRIQQIKQYLLPKRVIGFKPQPDEWAMLYNRAGEVFMRTKNAGMAAQWFEKAYEIAPKNARTLTNIGRLYSVRDQDLQAEKMYKQAIQLDPQFSLAFFHLGQLYAIQGFDKKGITYLEKGMTLEPQNPRGTLALGSLYMRHKRYAKAKALFENTLHSVLIPQESRRQIEHLYEQVSRSIK